MKTLKMFLAILAVALLAAAPAGAAGFATNVGGLPIVVTLTGTSASSAVDVTWDTPAQFKPDFVQCWDDATAQSKSYTWITGMLVSATRLNTESSGVVTFVSSAGSGCWFDMSTAGTIIIDAACQTNSKIYSCIAIRYAQ